MTIKSVIKKPKTLWANRDKIARGIAVSMFIALSLVTVVDLVKWHDKNEIHFQSPITLKPPVYAELRKLTVIQEVQASDPNNSPLTPDQQFACNLFGKDCDTALAIMRAESHYRHDAININKNGTADFGCFQLNSVHLAQIDTSNLNLLNCQDNTKAAYEIYKQQKGFGAWVTFTNGSYKQFLINK